jgi:hypothetical protein
VLAGGLALPEPSQPGAQRKDGHDRPRRAWVDAVWRGIGRTCRVLVAACVVTVALLGALLQPRVSMAVALFLGVLTAGVVALVNPDFPAQPSARVATGLAGFSGVVAAHFGAGVMALGTGGAVVVLVLLVLVPLWVTQKVLEEAPGWTSGDLVRMGEAVPAMSTAELLDTWVATDRALGGTSAPVERERAVELRAVLLDELGRRDPSGVAAWLRHPGSRPDAYIGAERAD